MNYSQEDRLLKCGFALGWIIGPLFFMYKNCVYEGAAFLPAVYVFIVTFFLVMTLYVAAKRHMHLIWGCFLLAIIPICVLTGWPMNVWDESYSADTAAILLGISLPYSSSYLYRSVWEFRKKCPEK